MTVYTLTGLRKYFGTKRVLDIDHCQIEKGQIVCLHGPNGAGKTTLLKILGFLEKPTKGEIQYNGRRVIYQEPVLHPLRRQIVMVNQDPILFSTTVYKNIEFGLKIRKVSKIERDKTIYEVLDLVGMRQFAQEKAPLLSGGEARRISLARALALQPQVLLCDEPTASVDLENQAVIFNLLQSINQEKNTTLIVTTHDRFRPYSFSHRTIHLHHGSISSTLIENIFTAVIQKNNSGPANCCIQDSINIQIPTSKTGQVRIAIDAKQLKPVDSQEHAVQEQNNFYIEGKVVQIGEDNGNVRVGVEAGIYLTLLLPRDDYSVRPCIVGQNLTVRIPADAIRILRD